MRIGDAIRNALAGTEKEFEVVYEYGGFGGTAYSTARRYGALRETESFFIRAADESAAEAGAGCSTVEAVHIVSGD